ncbi:amino acid adenylation domain-containing protein, partial [Paraburkholderia steynii]
DLLPPDERTLLLETWNRTQSPYPMDRCIHQLFEDQVRAAPGATALIFGDDTVSFEQLNAQANQLAHFLVQQGVKPDDRVAICVERSIELVIGVLAVLKAGCAYVPLDPAYPSGRLGTILMDADPAFLLCDVTGRRLFDEEKLHGRRLVELDSASPVWNDCTDSNLDPRDLGLLPEHMAYVIYTSGSTGTPKGVMVEHRQLVNYFTWALPNYYADAGGSGSPTTMSFSFDGSVTVILGALIAGQPLTILPTEQQFESILNGRPYALVKLTPSHLKVLNSLLASGNPLPPACKLLLGGEAIAPDDLEIWQRMYPGVALINEYGPTETTIGCTTYTVTGPTNGMTHVPIGRPIANTRVYLLDDHHQPVPIGARGEIYIGGDGVTRGYLNRPDLTAERFLTDPFSSSTGARMYRTGDLARYLPDGNLIYLGRNDNQIKIRGFRIEPGEIEKCLTEHPSVSEAIVIASNTDTDIRLTAYVAPHANVTEDLSRPTALESELRIHAAKRLPSYMVPTMFVFLDAFPRSPNGKLDHGALPYPGSAQSQELQGGAPQGPIEAFIATVWMDLFDRSDIDRADNFFDLGGHSLLVINLISLCKRKGLLLTASDVFQHPVLHTLAARLESNIGKNDDDLVIIRAGKCGVPVYFVPSGKGDYSYAFNLTSNIKADCPIYAIPWPSVKEMKNLATMSGMAQRAIGVIKQIQPQGPYRLIGYSSGGILAHAIAKALTMAGDIVSFVGLIDVPTPSEKLFPAITAKRLFLEEIYRSANKSTADRITLIQRNADDISLEDLITRCTNDGLITDQFDRFSDSATWERRSTYTSAIRNYNPAGLEARVHHFHATECSNNGSVDIDTTLSEEDERCPSPAFLWKEIPTPNKMEFVGIPGDHFSMIEDPTNNMRLAKHLDNCLSNGIWTADDFGTQ